MNSRLTINVLLLLCAAIASGQQPEQKGAQPTGPSRSPVLVIQGLGRGTVPINGAWQFHLGDDLNWAQPSFDDSGWETIRTNDSWGAQGHPGYTGFAWYRRHVNIIPAPGDTAQYRVAILDDAEDAYELYWNGKLIGQYGKLPPHPTWYYNYSSFPSSFPLTGSMQGVLAIRVWKAPLDAYDPADEGGVSTPSVGDAHTISLAEDEHEFRIIRGDLFDYGLVMLRVFIALLCVVQWIRNRKQHLFIWVAIYAAAPVAIDILNHLFRIPFPWTVARFLNQPIYALFHVSFWFLLIWLLRLHDNRAVVGLAKTLAYFALAAATADGMLALFWGSATLWMQWADGLLDNCIILAEVFPFVVIYMALRHKLDAARWVVALSALLVQSIDTVEAASALGQRFTHSTLFDFLNNPLFPPIQGVRFYPQKVASLVLFAAILYAVYRYVLEQQARQNMMEREIQSAREIQQVLVPETLPALEGYAVTSAYQPAMEVGGDFFQIIPNDDGSAIVALGDVSGKGLKAGMNVSMIVGVLRAEAGTTSPAELLASLNRCLVGRMSGGFATGVVFRLDPDGTVTFANAGHLPPYLNGQQHELDASLPLGLISYSDYTEMSMTLQPGDQLSVYSDGLLEATSPTGELFGFDRMNALFANRPTAQEAMKAAIEFGQEDDITVLTITRLAAGVESTTSLSAPELAPEAAEA